MAKYLVHGSYATEGVRGLLKEGRTSRREAITKLVETAGGTVEAFYYAFGDTDLYLIVDVPDNTTMAALSLLVNAAGAATSKITVLLSPEEIDAATKITATYRPPGS